MSSILLFAAGAYCMWLVWLAIDVLRLRRRWRELGALHRQAVLIHGQAQDALLRGDYDAHFLHRERFMELSELIDQKERNQR